MSSYDEEILTEFKDEFDSETFRRLGDVAGIFRELARFYPSRGSKIDWERIPGAIDVQMKQGGEYVSEFIKFFNETCDRESLMGAAIYVGDSNTDIAIEADIGDMRSAVPFLAEIPQHHYFISSNYSWCMCITMEGDMGFGRKVSGVK